LYRTVLRPRHEGRTGLAPSRASGRSTPGTSREFSLPTTDPDDRVLIVRAAVHESWSRTADPAARTANARAAALDRFEKQVDPDGVLPPDERARRAEHAKKAYFYRLALKSARARRRGTT
jgi:hypothetical protein